jgi:hypothetical protein
VELRAKGKNILGHVHGDKMIDLPLSSEIRERIEKEAALITNGSHSKDDKPNDERENTNNKVNVNASIQNQHSIDLNHTHASLPPNYVYRESGWVCFYPRQGRDDISVIIYYFRQRYDMILRRKSRVMRMIPF